MSRWFQVHGDAVEVGFDSLVTVTLQPHGSQETMMTIEHVQLPPQWSADHQRGWTRIAALLEARLADRP